MRPSFHEIERAAYDRWERRGGDHGGHADDWYDAEIELIFFAHYRKVAELALDGPGPHVLGDLGARRCRFCERTARQADFGDPRPIVPGRRSPATAEVCNECRGDWLDALDDEFRRAWDRLVHDPQTPLSLAAYKAMVTGALVVMPPTLLPFFVDALEWVSNPDHELDDMLLSGAACRVYRADFLRQEPGVSLYRRIDDDEPVPFVVYFLRADGLMVQLALPMCLRDEDLDGRTVEHPTRALGSGTGYEYQVVLRQAVAAGRVRPASSRAPSSFEHRLLRSS